MAYDILIIGGGPGGYVAAIKAAQLGAKVGVVEKDELGGTCLNRGCIPTKTLLSSVSTLAHVKHAANFGINVDNYSVDFPKMMDRKEKVVAQLVKGIHYLFKKNKIELIRGQGKVIEPGKVQVATGEDELELLAKNIIVATGSEPALIKALGYNGRTVITSNEALSLEAVPESMLIIGGGVIGCEFATIFSELGCSVTILEAMPTILPMIDKDVARRQQSLLKRRGIAIKTGAMITEVTETNQGIKAVLDNGHEFSAQKALISIGRTFNTEGLGLKEIGVQLGPKGEVLVDNRMRTNVEGIYAIGDVTNIIQLAHVASAQGIVAVENIMGIESTMNYAAVPSCIFTLPEVASVGITSQEAEKKGIPVKEGKFNFIANGKALSMDETDGLVKIIAHADNNKVLGVHIIGPHAADLIAEATLAVQHGLTSEQLARTIHAHPTLAETIMEAAEAVDGHSIHG